VTAYPVALREIQASFEAALERLIPAADTEPPELHEAMRYSLLAGGKRVRPAICCLFAEAVGGERADAFPVAAALECVHVYSLIHDDLPAMDDDDMRRGRPSSHKAFGEAIAILAGDALLTLAFELCTQLPDAETARVAVRVLARAAGSQGMVGGQVLDLRGEGRTREPVVRTEAALVQTHRGKTAALLRAAAVTGALAGGGEAAHLEAARRYGDALGLSFQVTDDILDVTQTSEALGKTAGKDEASGKLTYPALLGLDGARERAASLTEDAIAALCALPDGPGRRDLAQLARFVRDRTA